MLNDLRPDKVPLRSQEMVEALEDAIQRYQQIVSNGGWPAIPGTRPIRPEDNDERVGLLYRRLATSGEWRGGPASPCSASTTPTAWKPPCGASRRTTDCASPAGWTGPRCRR